jgi:hypothetical protein
VPLEPTIFRIRPYSELYRDFCARYKPHHSFNEKRGTALLDFMLAHFMEETPVSEQLNRGLRSKILAYARGIESTYSMRESNCLGPVYTAPGSDLPKFAHRSAIDRLI